MLIFSLISSMYDWAERKALNFPSHLLSVGSLTPELSTRQKSIQSLSHLQSETIFYHHKYFMETNFWEKEVSWNDMNKETGEILVSPVNPGYQFHNNDSNVQLEDKVYSSGSTGTLFLKIQNFKCNHCSCRYFTVFKNQ